MFTLKWRKYVIIRLRNKIGSVLERVFSMGNEIETIYYLENPEKDLKTFATGSQLKYDDIIKDVFGVACIKDLPMMIQYNKSFQDSICSSKGIRENEITLEMVLRVASKMELLQLRNKYVDRIDNGDNLEPLEAPFPFDPIIRLREGIFQWDQKNFSYDMVRIS